MPRRLASYINPWICRHEFLTKCTVVTIIFTRLSLWQFSQCGCTIRSPSLPLHLTLHLPYLVPRSSTWTHEPPHACFFGILFHSMDIRSRSLSFHIALHLLYLVDLVPTHEPLVQSHFDCITFTWSGSLWILPTKIIWLTLEFIYFLARIIYTSFGRKFPSPRATFSIILFFPCHHTLFDAKI
jgi:hypothetical protein